jgi:hypothetical protein
MQQKLSQAIGIVLLGGMLWLLSGATGEPSATAYQAFASADGPNSGANATDAQP